MSINALVDEIERKSKLIITRLKRLENENEELKKSVFTYLELMDKQAKEIHSLEEKLKVKQITKNTSADLKKLQRDIDKYIHMVDKCIASINADELEPQK